MSGKDVGAAGGPVAPPSERVDPPGQSALKTVRCWFSVRRPCWCRSVFVFNDRFTPDIDPGRLLWLWILLSIYTLS